MSIEIERPLVIGVSSRALFDVEEAHKIFNKHGFDAFVRHQRKRENDPLEPGVAFPLVKALLALNRLAPTGKKLVDVIVMSSTHPDAGMRVMNSITHHEMDISRAAFTGGSRLVPYVKAFGVDLLLSRSVDDIQDAIDSGIAGAVMYDRPKDKSFDALADDQIRIAFDGDAVIFSDESERFYKEFGLAAFQENEAKLASVPMQEGPFARFLATINVIQKAADAENISRPFRIALVTARGGESRKRVIQTLRAWDIAFDESFFMMGLPKSQVLSAFQPHIFFDDQDKHVSLASNLVPSGRVPYKSDSAMAETLADAQGKTAA